MIEFGVPPKLAKPAIIRPRPPHIVRPGDPEYRLPGLGAAGFALTPLSGFGAGGGDGGNDQYTKLLLHFDGADASTTITDSNAGGSAHTWTAAGNAQIDTAIAKFGGAALLCDGTGDRVYMSDHADLTLGAGAWAFDCWFNWAGGSGVRGFVAGQCDSGGAATSSSITIEHRTTNTMRCAVAVSTTAYIVDLTTSITTAGWHWLAFNRTGDTLRAWLNGTQEGGDVAIAGTVNDSSNQFSIGAGGEITTLMWAGSIDEARLSVGTNRGWTGASIPVPTAPYH